ncbi:MAG TPA: DUF4129 domain-containing protein, partial [Acidimicrobiia bacterium]|nr:DUF4129 domain-containing protein [Acidimicrobiia bacterium]
ERAGRRAGRARAPAETPREYAGALADHFGEPRLAEVGEVLDREAFSAGGAPAEERRAVEAVLTSL